MESLRLRKLRSSRPDRWLILSAVVISTLAGCSTPPEPPSPSIVTTDDLLAALRDSGLEVEETAMLALLGELAGGRVYFMDGARLEVFEYDSIAAREEASASWVQPLIDSGAAIKQAS